MKNRYAEHSRVKEARGCIRKKFYHNAIEANLAMERSHAKNFYKCLFCRGWHITSQAPRANP